MTSQDLDQARKKAEFDRLMTAATVHRRRGDYAQATQSVKQALQLLPDDLDAREFAADMIHAHGDVQRASEYYKSILEADPGRVSAEQKFAKAVVELAEAERQRELIKLMVENPGKFRAIQPKSPNIAALLSIAPGFGHIYCGNYMMGMAIFGTWILACVLFLITLNPTAHIAQRVTTASAVFACIAGAVHIYALLTAPQQAEKLKSGKTAKDPSEPE